MDALQAAPSPLLLLPPTLHNPAWVALPLPSPLKLFGTPITCVRPLQEKGLISQLIKSLGDPEKLLQPPAEPSDNGSSEPNQHRSTKPNKRTSSPPL